MSEIIEILKRYGEFTDGIEYDAVIRHTLVDEFDWLKKLGEKPEDCIFCDVILAFEERLVFITIFSTYLRDKESNVIYKYDKDASHGGDQFSVATIQFPLKKENVNKALKFISDWLSDGNNQIRESKPKKSVKITDKDICK